ncbi:MAG: hypothetical protein KatS3mg078_2270 [Deltaproteobacteria bacterium]|jgi:CRISPR-associated protein Csm2|nr:MAG: hypothetical protein KatS3mg078_2270 [Deltaproteobacteria bacterium]
MIKNKDIEKLQSLKGRLPEGKNRDQRTDHHDENRIIKTIREDALTPRNLVECAKELGELLVKRGLKSAKLRRIYDPVTTLKVKLRSILAKDESERAKELENIRASLLFLKPKLKSESRREKRVEPLANALEAYIDRIIDSNDIKDYENFVNFFEAVVGYHKGLGGKD